MKKKPLILGLLIFIGLSVALSRFLTGIHWISREQSSLNLRQEGKEWQQQAAQFDRDKVNAAAFFNGATKVEGFRLFANSAEKPLGETSDFSYYSKIEVRDRRFAARLAAIVLDPKTYPSPGHSTKSCEFDPAVTFRVWKKQQFVDTVICFQCSELQIYENDKDAPKVAGDFDTVRPALLALIKEAISNDKAIQEIR